MTDKPHTADGKAKETLITMLVVIGIIVILGLIAFGPGSHYALPIFR
jgi:competence protein ComGC